MRKTLLAGLVGMLFVVGAPLASANISYDSNAPTAPQDQFFTYCGPYEHPFVAGGYYEPFSSSACIYGLTSNELSQPNIFMGIYKGTPGNATLIDFDFSGQLGPSVLFTSPNSFNGLQGDDFFSVAVGYNSFDDLLAENSAFTSGGVPPLAYGMLAWKWGVDPSTLPPSLTSPLTVTANSTTVMYGSPIPLLTATLSGFVNGDTPASNDVTGSASCTTSATLGSPAGDYPIVCTIGSLSSAANYTFDTFQDGVLTITKTPLTLTASGGSAVYGSPIPPFVGSLSGFVNGDTAFSSTSGFPSCSTTATSQSGVGTYPVTCSLGSLSAQNYTFATFFPGLFAITKAPLAVKADNKVMTVGAALPLLTATISGFVGADTAQTSTSGAASCSTTATSASPAGTYPITCSSGTLASNNYAFTSFIAGTLTVQYRFDGFLQPINDTAHQVGQDMSVFKGGSTVPVKFQIKKANGTVVQASSTPQWLTPVKLGLMSSAIDELVYSDPADSGSTYKWDGIQYQYNWSTKGLQSGYWYRIFAKLDDGEIFSVVIGLK